MLKTINNLIKNPAGLMTKLGVAALSLALISCGGPSNSSSSSSSSRVAAMPYDHAVKELKQKMQRINWTTEVTGRVEITNVGNTTLADTLPPINKFPLVVNPVNGDVVVEIFVSSEKSGNDTDGWMLELARDFNNQNIKLADGRTAKIKIRKIASGTGYQYIASRKHLPHAYSPSNHYWIQMAASQGVKMSPVLDKTVGNLAGLVMKKDTAKLLEDDQGNISISKAVDAVVQGTVVAGYTNPFASSTGLNFLISVLATFSNDEASMLSPEVVSAFEGFQQNVPFVAMTTLQMRDSVANDGSLDMFVMEYQTFKNTKAFKSDYIFVPFGQPHNNPLYAVGQLSAGEQEVLQRFADLASSSKYQSLASQYNFNPSIKHQPTFGMPAGSTLISAQKLWKEKKDAGRPIAAIFLADVSGSMHGGRISNLKKALIDGSSFVSPDNSVGLVTFSDKVTHTVPIKPFKSLQKSAFVTAVDRMTSGGGTAMYDGVLVSLGLLIEEKKKNPDIKPVLLVLTDGNTSSGYKFTEVEEIVRGIGIPIYTIGFESNIAELKKLSSLVEAASINTEQDDISYKIGALLNTQI